MSVVDFKRRDEKQQILEMLEDFDFKKGAVVLLMDSDREDFEGEFQLVTTYDGFGVKETFAAQSISSFITSNSYSVEDVD